MTEVILCGQMVFHSQAELRHLENKRYLSSVAVVGAKNSVTDHP